jgi:hypothetical protein
MTYIEIAVSLIVLSFFTAGFAAAAFPVLKAWNMAEADHARSRVVAFVADSFRQECGKKNRNIENWKKAAAAAAGLDEYEITELRKNGVIYALKLSCAVGGESFEVVGECAP